MQFNEVFFLINTVLKFLGINNKIVLSDRPTHVTQTIFNF